MKDLSSQVAKYDKEIALIQHEKNLQLEMMKADSSDPELATLDAQSHDRNTMERRKRQRDEDIVDTSLYMNNHEILSYYYGRDRRLAIFALAVASIFCMLDNDDLSQIFCRKEKQWS
jgi:hypothetical protein